MMACHAPNLTALCPRLREWAEERHLAVAIPSPPDCISDFPEEHHSSPSLQEQRRLLLGSRCGTPRFLFRPASAAFSTSAASASSSPHPSATVRSATCQPVASAPIYHLPAAARPASRETTARSPSCLDGAVPSPTVKFPRSCSDSGTGRLMKLARCDLLGSRCGTPRRATGADPRAFHHRARSVTWDLPRDEIPFSHSNPVPSRGCLRLLRADVLGSKCGTPKFRAPAEPEAIWSV
ncbi:unnamed protein product [Closterium sp. NIES-65]|nr:unnamed protein product [Closterium sp. NIES-65]